MYAAALASFIIDQSLVFVILSRLSKYAYATSRWFPLVGQPWSSLVALVIIGLLAYKRRHWSLGFALGGALSNLATYVIHGRAVDYISLGFARTNLADILIVLGLAIFFIKKSSPEGA